MSENCELLREGRLCPSKSEKVQIEVYGRAIDIERRADGKFVKPDILRRFGGWNVALKPAAEDWWVAMKPLEGTFAQNALKWGVAGLNIDGCRVGTDTITQRRNSGGCKFARKYDGHGENLPVNGEVTQTTGRWPPNLVLSHSEGCVRTGKRRVATGTAVKRRGVSSNGVTGWGQWPPGTPDCGYADADGMEEVDDWECTPECAVRLLGEQSGELKSGQVKPGYKRGAHREVPTYGEVVPGSQMTGFGDSGTAARFYPQFEGERMFYCPKASRREREMGLEGLPRQKVNKMRSFGDQTDFDCPDGAHRVGDKGSAMMRNTHATVKPLALMRWLVRLCKTPTGGVVLDPFMGSGTTGCACAYEGRPFIGIELEPEYMEIAELRIAAAQADKPKQMSLLDD